MNLDHRLQDDPVEGQELQGFIPLGNEREREREEKKRGGFELLDLGDSIRL